MRVLETHFSGRRLRAAAALVVALFAAPAPPAAATTVAPQEPEALAASSDLVAVVEIRSTSSAWVGRRILTFYEAEVVEVWRTRDAVAPRRVLLALPGGVVGAIGQRVPGMPVLEVGRRYVACLGDDDGPRGARGIMGFWQGLWRLEQEGVSAFGHAGPVLQPAVDASSLRGRLGGGQ